MADVAFFSTKTNREIIKISYLILIAVITWILQLSIFSRIQYFDSACNLMLLGSIYMGLFINSRSGAVFGLISSFFTASILYDHIFYLSFPLLGFISGLLIKYTFSEEILFFVMLSFLLSIPFEILNFLQCDLSRVNDVSTILLNVVLNSTVLNLLISPFYYLLMTSITKKLKLR